MLVTSSRNIILVVHLYQKKKKKSIKKLQISASRKTENGILDKLFSTSLVLMQLRLWADWQRSGPTFKEQPDLQTSRFIAETQNRRLLFEITCKFVKPTQCFLSCA